MNGNHPVTEQGIPAEDNNNRQGAGWQDHDINPVTFIPSSFLIYIPQKTMPRVNARFIIVKSAFFCCFFVFLKGAKLQLWLMFSVAFVVMAGQCCRSVMQQNLFTSVTQVGASRVEPVPQRLFWVN